MGAIDLALWDLNGKALGLPAYRLLGGLVQRRLPVDHTLGKGAPAETARQAVAMAEQGGFTAFCVKVGGGDPLEEDVARVHEVRAAIGPRARLRADANGGYDLDTATAVMRAIEPYDVEFLEQPLPAGDLEGLKHLAARTGVPISVDESLRSLADAFALANSGAVRVSNIKAPRCGDLWLSKKIAAVAQAAGIACICGGALTLEVIRQASRHFTASTPLNAQGLAHEGPGPASQGLQGNVTRRVVEEDAAAVARSPELVARVPQAGCGGAFDVHCGHAGRR